MYFQNNYLDTLDPKANFGYGFLISLFRLLPPHLLMLQNQAHHANTVTTSISILGNPILCHPTLLHSSKPHASSSNHGRRARDNPRPNSAPLHLVPIPNPLPSPILHTTTTQHLPLLLPILSPIPIPPYPAPSHIQTLNTTTQTSRTPQTNRTTRTRQPARRAHRQRVHGRPGMGQAAARGRRRRRLAAAAGGGRGGEEAGWRGRRRPVRGPVRRGEVVSFGGELVSLRGW